MVNVVLSEYDVTIMVPQVVRVRAESLQLAGSKVKKMYKLRRMEPEPVIYEVKEVKEDAQTKGV